MVKLYKNAILAKKNYEIRKTKKNLHKFLRTGPSSNVTQLNLNQSYDILKLPQDNDIIAIHEDPNNRKILIEQNYLDNNYTNFFKKDDIIMNYKNIEILELEKSIKNNCYLNSHEKYKFFDNRKNNNSELYINENDMNSNLQTDEQLKSNKNNLFEDDGPQIKILENKRKNIKNKNKNLSLFNDKSISLDIIILI
jgi:hypothetical protein